MEHSLSQAIELIETHLATEADKHTVARLNKALSSVNYATRQCTGCGRDLTRDNFYSSSKKGKRITSWNINQPCKECVSERNKKVDKWFY